MQTTERVPGSVSVEPAVGQQASERRWPRRWAPMLLLVVIVAPLNLLHVARIATISPLDELMHIDYLVRASTPGFLRMSDQFTQEGMNEVACRRHPTQPLPPCGQRPYQPEQFSWKGHNLASSHSPWYYMITGLAARPLRALLPGDSLVTWGRALGSLWLLAGFWFALSATRRLGVNEWHVVPFLALLALSPSTQHAATTINPDATAVLAGALVLLATIRALERSAPVWWVLGASVFAVALDPGNLLVVLAMMLFTVLTGRRSVLRLASVAGALGAGYLVGEASNRVLLHLLGTVDYSGNPQDVLFSVRGLTGPMVWGESAVLALVPPTKGYLFPVLSTPAHVTAAGAAIALATAGLVIGAVAELASGDRRVRPLAVAGLATLLTGGPLLVAVRYYLGGMYFPIPARYGLSLVPVVGLAGGAALGQTRCGRAMVIAVVVALGSTSAYALR